MLSEFLDPEKLHHAYVLTVASIAHAKASIEKFISEKMKLPFHGNPDVFVSEYESIGIDDLADVVSMHQRVPLGSKKIIILLANNITAQAQNSILKMIEEPTANTHFFIALPTSNILLPTVLSRVHVLDIREQGQDEESGLTTNAEAKKFLKSTPPERLEMVKTVMADLDKERITKEDVIRLVSDIVELAHKKDASVETLTALARVSDYLRDPSSSLKMLFEYLSLRLAVLK